MDTAPLVVVLSALPPTISATAALMVAIRGGQRSTARWTRLDARLRSLEEQVADHRAREEEALANLVQTVTERLLDR